MEAKKSLGQHFLTNQEIIDKIMDEVREHPVDNLLEVGAGGGALTRELVTLPGIQFKTVEIDDDKIPYLEKQWPQLSVNILHGDFLKMDRPFDSSFAVVGNFPYNISTEILFRILDWRAYVPLVIGMFQKEVALRVAAPPGSKTYGVTSALIQPYYSIDYLFDVPPDCFNPPPKVMSGVIRMTPSSIPFAPRSEKDYRLLVKAAFNQRRKKLRNALRSWFSAETLQDAIFDKRAEELSVAEFESLTFLMT